MRKLFDQTRIVMLPQAASHRILIVSDAWHRQGLGADLLKRLVEAAKKEKIRRVVGHILPENHAMQQACRRAGFKVTGTWSDAARADAVTAARCRSLL